MDIPELIDEARAALGGISQAELARRLDRSGSAVSNWYSRQTTPDLESCLKLAGITHRSADEVLVAAGHDTSILQVVRERVGKQPERTPSQRLADEAARQIDEWVATVGVDGLPLLLHLWEQDHQTVRRIQQGEIAVKPVEPVAINQPNNRPGGRRRREGKGSIRHASHLARAA